jgi:hypothetical protein
MLPIALIAIIIYRNGINWAGLRRAHVPGLWIMVTVEILSVGQSSGRHLLSINFWIWIILDSARISSKAHAPCWLWYTGSPRTSINRKKTFFTGITCFHYMTSMAVEQSPPDVEFGVILYSICVKARFLCITSVRINTTAPILRSCS